ncbi:MAG TPA: HAMP domain-containing sensor histidine kinase [Caulobacteraceae bacterium]|jgi:signal transduction histidine kinase|nr:HAMP domain-containing sensor histidine kinase [Caulobacteraceae bacterium]
MADAAPLAPPARRRFPWLQGLSARLLLLTVVIVAIANLMILPPNLAADEQQYLLDRLRAAELATLVEETAPGGVVTDRMRSALLDNAGVVSVAFQIHGERRLILQAPRLARAPYLLDLRHSGPMPWLAPFEVMASQGDPMLRVMARPRFRAGDFVEVVLPEEPLRRELDAQLGRLLSVALFTSFMAGAVVYLSLNFFLVRPMQRITRAMERFRADPEDPRARLEPSGRRDEIGRAEAELDRMQADLRLALASRARLAALGEAVAKISHDLRNMLTSAQLASERLAASGDPGVAQTLPRLERALGRALSLSNQVLAFGRSDEPPPEKRPVALAEALAAAAEDAGLGGSHVELKSQIAPQAQVLADPEQLHRILTNLLKNSREAIEGARATGGEVSATLHEDEAQSRLMLGDNGPGMPERALTNLFQPFTGSARRGGVGLGLAIARELAQAHGGDLRLVHTGADGSVFELVLPKG